jgi:neutral ceramidase
MTQKSPTTSAHLCAGAAQADITPQTDIHLAGAVGEFRPAQYVHDPLYAKALVLQNGEKKICFVSLDLTIITEDWTERIRYAVADECDLAPEAIMVHVTQTHTAPSLGHFMFDESFQQTPSDMEWLRGGDPRYFDFAFERIIQTIKQANDSLQPVRIRVGSGIEGRLAFNRRAVMNDGSVRMPGPKWPEPLGPNYIRYMEGPTDPEVGVMCLQAESMQMVAMLLHHTCHPVNVFPRPIVSADWPGAWSNAMREAFGDHCVPLILNGCCGNINPWDPYDPDYVPDHRRMGNALAETTLKVMEILSYEEDNALDYGSRRIKLPIRDVKPELLAQSKRILDEYPEPRWSEQNPRRVDGEWMKAASILSVHLLKQRSPELDYEIQAFRVGETAFVGLPGEPFVEGQLQIKIGSPTYPTYVAHCVSHYVGYLPTRDAFQRGGHEVETRFWSKLRPDALEMVVNNAVELLHEISGH